MPPTYTIGQQFTFFSGSKVICNGYPGTVIAPYPDPDRPAPGGLVEVRLDRGSVCVSSAYPDCYPAPVEKMAHA